MRDAFYVYIMASNNRRALYIGVTNSLFVRIQQHRQQTGKGFTAQYHCVHLIYFETYRDPRDAIARETQLKKWRREKKLRLIEGKNPRWEDLSAEIVEELPRIDEALRPEAMV